MVIKNLISHTASLLHQPYGCTGVMKWHFSQCLCVFFVPLLYELFCHIVICIASWVALAALLWVSFVQFCCSCASRFTVSCFHAKQQCHSRTLTYRAKWDPWRVSSERHPLCLCIQSVVSYDLSHEKRSASS